MAFNFSETVLVHAQNTFGRQVIITPVKSQPNGQPYVTRGILETEAFDVTTMEGIILSDTRVILDIRDAEIAVQPLQGDLVDIPAEGTIPAEGQFEVMDSDPDGGGETTLTLRHIVPALP
jgi:hypothetical protein